LNNLLVVVSSSSSSSSATKMNTEERNGSSSSSESDGEKELEDENLTAAVGKRPHTATMHIRLRERIPSPLVDYNSFATRIQVPTSPL
jgi:hypothetical protein